MFYFPVLEPYREALSRHFSLQIVAYLELAWTFVTFLDHSSSYFHFLFFLFSFIFLRGRDVGHTQQCLVYSGLFSGVTTGCTQRTIMDAENWIWLAMYMPNAPFPFSNLWFFMGGWSPYVMYNTCMFEFEHNLLYTDSETGLPVLRQSTFI